MSKEAIIEQIEAQAHTRAQAIIDNAKADTAAKKAKAEEEFKADFDKRMAGISAETEQMIAGQKTLIGIDGKKAELKVKRELIDEVYELAARRITSLGVEEYKNFVARLITKFADDGDVVIIGKCDAGKLTAAWLSDVAFDMQISLSLAKEYHDDVGGVILRGQKFDKNLTVSAIMNEARKGTESAVAARLFG